VIEEPAQGPDAPRQGLQVSAVRFATAQARRSSSFLRYELYGLPDADIACDYYFWVVRGSDGVVLFDVGFGDRAARRWGRRLHVTMDECLGALEVQPADVRTIVVSHFHYDHIGNLSLFPEAELVVQSAELDFWRSAVAAKVHFASVADEVSLALVAQAEAEGRVRPIDGDTALRPGLAAVWLPGHTPGQQGLMVGTGRSSVLLTSDAVHYYEELEHDMPFAIVSDVADMYRSFDLVRSMEAGGAMIVPGHASEVRSRFETRNFGTGGLIVDLTPA
jgi:glyoxylase-like metal-dependent hydrolase (beta-lactamase superfamily II)